MGLRPVKSITQSIIRYNFQNYTLFENVLFAGEKGELLVSEHLFLLSFLSFASDKSSNTHKLKSIFRTTLTPEVAKNIICL